MQNPEFRESYERTRRTIEKIQEILKTIDAERLAAGISKAVLADRSGTNAASLRRLLTSGTGNPTLKTVIELLDTLDIEVQLKPRFRRKGTAAKGRLSAETRRRRAKPRPFVQSTPT